jgi:predicted RNase H-like HicB family nuclease
VKFIVTLERDEDGFVVAECPTLPGCLSQDRTEAEALANIREAIDASLETRRAYGIARN